MEFFKRLFASKRKTDSRDRFVRPRLEAFEARDLPNASPLFTAFHARDFDAQAWVGSLASDWGGLSFQCQAAGQTTTLTATLTGATGTSGEARYSTNTTAGTNEFSVQVSGLTPDTTYNVVVGTTTETFTTDAKGRGHLSVSNFPGTVTANTMVTVETSTGTPVTVLSGAFAAPAAHTRLSTA